jgi:type IV pilus assembly protein PilB
MLPMSPEVANVIMNNGNSLDILRVAQSEGFRTLRLSGLIKVGKGLTSLEEMNRVIVT